MRMNKMNKEQAIQVIRQALLTLRATVQEHNTIQLALTVLIGEEKDGNTDK